MSIYNLTPVPKTLSMRLLGNTGLAPSPLIASAQTLDRGGLKWQATYNYGNMSGNNRAILLGLIARLRGQAHRVRLPVYDNPRRGVYGGTPLVDAASQTGSTLSFDGADNVTDWIKAGDYFSVVVNGEHELKMCTVDLTTSGGGGTLDFEPRLRASLCPFSMLKPLQVSAETQAIQLKCVPLSAPCVARVRFGASVQAVRRLPVVFAHARHALLDLEFN